MCRRMSTSSCKRPRAEYAAGDESNSWPATCTEIKQCLYPGCENTCSSERKFCGVMHCNLHMSNLAMRSRVQTPSPTVSYERQSSSSWAVHYDIVTNANSNNPKLCMLPNCLKRASANFEFCGKKHMLTMVEDLTKEWSLEGRLCKFTECCQHVYVKDDGTCYDYCGMKHATLAAARKGAMTVLESAAAAASTLNPKLIEKRLSIDHRVTEHPADCDVYVASDRQTGTSSCQEGKERELASLIDSERGYHDKISDVELQRLLCEGSDDERCTLVQDGVDIYDFHPWEVVKKFGGYRPRYFLHFVTQQREQNGHSQKRRKTKEGFSWKQSGRTHSPENKVLQTRYFKYMLEKPDKYGHLPHVKAYAEFNLPASKLEPRGKKKGPKCRWKMHEITLQESCQSGQVIWMIFQEAQGKPVWPPCRQKDPSDEEQRSVPTLSDPRENQNFAENSYGLLDPSHLPALVQRESKKSANDSYEGLDIIPARTEPNASPPDKVSDDFENDLGRSEAPFHLETFGGWKEPQQEFSDTETAFALNASQWFQSSQDFDFCEAQMEHQHPTDIGRLWMY